MENFGKFMTVVLAMIISPIVKGFVFVKLWSWFIVPIFGADPLRIVEAIGVMYFVGYLVYKRDEKEPKEDFWTQLIENLLFLVLFAGLTLLFGWIISLFM